MKHITTRAAALIAALFFVFTVLPLSAALSSVAAHRTAPAGYNEHDYAECVAFLEQTDPTGIKNGEKLSASYDPDDPATWGTYAGYSDPETGVWTEAGPRFAWAPCGDELRIVSIDVCDHEWSYERFLTGSLDVSDCTSLEVLCCGWNGLSELDISNNTALTSLVCSCTGLMTI